MAIHPTFQSTSAADQVYFQCVTGHPESVLTHLNRRVGQIARHWGYHRKIGITNDPNRRWLQAYRHNGWEYMTVLYQSSSHKNVCVLERAMVDRFREELSVSPGYYYNGVGGGGGRKPQIGPYYLYMVTGQRYSRITV